MSSSCLVVLVWSNSMRLILFLLVRNFHFCIFCLCCWAPVTLVTGGSSDTTNLVDRLLANYSRQISPHGDMPTLVELGIYVNSIYSVSEQTMDYSLNLYLRQQWTDPRLKYDPSKHYNISMIKLEGSMWEKLWVPDVFFRNEKRADFHQVTIPNRLMRLNSNGTLWYATKISATLSCMMNLEKYPLDTQTCPMMLESFGHTMNTVMFRWLNNSVEFEKDLSLPQFTLERTRILDCSQNYTTGSYPCLQLDFILRRNIGFFIIQIYVPTTLIVILSWVAFWINIEATPARVSLGLLTVLTMTAQSSGTGNSMPRVSYVKAIDVWMCACLVFVFASLLEFAVVNVLSRQRSPSQLAFRLCKHLLMDTNQRNRRTSQAVKAHARVGNTSFTIAGAQDCPESQNFRICTDLSFLEEGPEENYRLRPPTDGVTIARKIDKLARKGFPLSFLIFNCLYWIVYTIVK